MSWRALSSPGRGGSWRRGLPKDIPAEHINLKNFNMKMALKLKINPIREYLRLIIHPIKPSQGLFFLIKSCETIPINVKSRFSFLIFGRRMLKNKKFFFAHVTKEYSCSSLAFICEKWVFLLKQNRSKGSKKFSR
jgi:hypothetical protein